MVHRRSQRHRRRQEGLHLIKAKAVALEPQRKIEHVGKRRPRMGGDEVGDEVLLLASLTREFLEQRFELLVARYRRLHHVRQRAGFGVFRRDFEVAADVMRHQFLDVFRRANGKVITQPGADQDPLDPRHRPRLAVKRRQWRVIGIEVVTNLGENAGKAAARGFNAFFLAGQAVHIRRRPAKVGNDAGEPRRFVTNFLDFVQYGSFRAALDNAPLMFGDRAEGATAKTATHDADRKTDHLVGRDFGFAVGRMRSALVRQAIDMIHFRRTERNGRRIDPDITACSPVTVRLHQRTGVTRIRFEMQRARGMGIEHRVSLHLLIGWQADDGMRTLGTDRLSANHADRLRFTRHATIRRIGVGVSLQRAGGVDLAGIQFDPLLAGQVPVRRHEGRPAQIADRADGFTCGQTVREFDQRPFGVTVNQEIGLGIGQYRTAHLV